MRQLLQLKHHRHTGKLLHHRHTSYRGIALVLAVAGLFMGGLGLANHAAADDFGVQATVLAPVPTTAPIIASPAANVTFDSANALIVGSCPLIVPQVVITIRVDGAPAGTSMCDGQNDFSVPLRFTAGSHQIVASSETITGQQGPSSSPVAITTTAAVSSPTVSIVSDSSFSYVGSNTTTWTGTIGAAGQGTAHVHVDWGDGSQSNYAVSLGRQSFTHQYRSLGSHNIMLTAVTPSGAVGSQQFAAAAYTTAAPLVANVANTSSPFWGTRTMLGLDGLYLSVLAIAGIIWLEAKHVAREHARNAAMPTSHSYV